MTAEAQSTLRKRGRERLNKWLRNGINDFMEIKGLRNPVSSRYRVSCNSLQLG
jgi:hypothetical protein